MIKWSYLYFIILLITTPILYFFILLIALSFSNSPIFVIIIPIFLLIVAGVAIYFGVMNILQKRPIERKISDYIPVVLNSAMALLFLFTLAMVFVSVMTYFSSGY